MPMLLLLFSPVLDGHQLFQLLHHFSKNKNSIYTAYSSLGNKWHMLFLYKASRKRKKSERLLVGVEEWNKQKLNIKVQYISIVIIFERHTPVQVFWEKKKKKKQFKTMGHWAQQTASTSWLVSELMNVSAFTHFQKVGLHLWRAVHHLTDLHLKKREQMINSGDL